MNQLRFLLPTLAVACIGHMPLLAQRPPLGAGQSNAVPKPTDSLSTADLTTVSAADLVTALVGAGVTVSNITYTGAPIAGGLFAGGSGIVGFNSGVMLSTGNIGSVVGPNALFNTTTNNGRPGDANLNALSPFTQDAASLEFDFNCGGASTISFQYVFASEEYADSVGATFNDVFGLFLNGVNIALVPGTASPVTINNVNCGNPYSPPNGTNCALYLNNECGSGGLPGFPCAGNYDTEMDGLTVVFTATAALLPGTNHVKFAIADGLDHLVDSNVFLRGQTFPCASSSAPFFSAPTPCGQTLATSVGIPLTFGVVAGATSGLPGNAVTLSAVGSPAGATYAPPLPLTMGGATASAATVFTWTPGPNDTGSHTIVFRATDQNGQFTTCSVTIDVAECYLFLGFTETAIPLGPDPDDVVLLLPTVWYPVTTTTVPVFYIPNDNSLLNLRLVAQIGMLTPLVPSNQLQMSNGLRLTIGGGVQSYGFASGVTLTGDQPTLGSLYHFYFAIH